jgi:uncharacterized membrane protein
MGKKEIRWDKIILYIGIFSILIYAIHSYKEINKPTINQNVIENMQKDKDSLDVIKKESLDKYNNTTKERAIKQLKKNDEAIKEINNLPNLNVRERDSLLSRLFSSEDSLSRRYRDFLESKTRRKSSGNF